MRHHQDTTRRRSADAVRLRRHWRRLFGDVPLYFYTVPLWPGSVWDGQDIAAANLAASTILGNVGNPPAWVKLERGRCGGLHLHIVTPAPSLGLVPGLERREVYDAAGLAAYLSKPNDARMARRRPADLGRYSPEKLREQFRAALEEEAAARRARHGRRVSARSWSFRAGPGWRPPVAPRPARRRLTARPARPLAAPSTVRRSSALSRPARRPARRLTWQFLGVFRAGVGVRGCSLVMA